MESITGNIIETPQVVTGSITEERTRIDGDIREGDPITPATVRNSDSTYSETVSCGGLLVLPNITFTDSDGGTSAVPAVKDITATPAEPVTIEDTAGNTLYTAASGSTQVISDSIAENSEGTQLASILAEATEVILDIEVTKNDGSVYQYPAGKNLTESSTNRIAAIFPATYDNSITIDIDANSAGAYSTATLTNVATIAYEKNGSSASLPVAVSNGDTLKVTITRTNSALLSKVILT